jgi:hypothetical protein
MFAYGSRAVCRRAQFIPLEPTCSTRNCSLLQDCPTAIGARREAHLLQADLSGQIS